MSVGTRSGHMSERCCQSKHYCTRTRTIYPDRQAQCSSDGISHETSPASYFGSSRTRIYIRAIHATTWLDQGDSTRGAKVQNQTLLRVSSWILQATLAKNFEVLARGVSEILNSVNIARSEPHERLCRVDGVVLPTATLAPPK
jgi:hypothetical protein